MYLYYTSFYLHFNIYQSIYNLYCTESSPRDGITFLLCIFEILLSQWWTNICGMNKDYMQNCIRTQCFLCFPGPWFSEPPSLFYPPWLWQGAAYYSTKPLGICSLSAFLHYPSENSTHLCRLSSGTTEATKAEFDLGSWFLSFFLVCVFSTFSLHLP